MERPVQWGRPKDHPKTAQITCPLSLPHPRQAPCLDPGRHQFQTCSSFVDAVSTARAISHTSHLPLKQVPTCTPVLRARNTQKSSLVPSRQSFAHYQSGMWHCLISRCQFLASLSCRGYRGSQTHRSDSQHQRLRSALARHSARTWLCYNPALGTPVYGRILVDFISLFSGRFLQSKYLRMCK